MSAGLQDGRRTRVIYVTAGFPYGGNEPFLLPEIVELGRQGCDVTVVPVLPQQEDVHEEAVELESQAVSLPVLSGPILRAALVETWRAPGTVAHAFLSLAGSRSVRVFVKNLAVFPKALWLAEQARLLGADHLHAHWAGTSATLAMLASRVSGVSWSVTAHRWDIREDNLLRLKARDACFVRAISARGAEELMGVVGEPGWSPWLLHMGVRLPPRLAPVEPGDPPLRVLTAAAFREVKGHAYLLDAVGLLKERGVPVRAELAGEGTLSSSLRRRVRDLGLEDEVVFLGRVPHGELLAELAAGRWHAAVLPSIVAASGAQEGIPVSLIEAMACGLPVVGTAAGAVPELLDGAGMVVAPGDPAALATAIATLAEDSALRAELGARGRARVEEAFSVERIAAELHERFRACGGAS